MYMAETNHRIIQCDEQTKCDAGEKYVYRGLGVAALCEGCAVRSYQDETDHRVDDCVTQPACGAGYQYSEVETRDRQRSCTSCPDGEFQSAVQHWEAECTEWTVCTDDEEYQSQVPSAAINRVCVPAYTATELTALSKGDAATCYIALLDGPCDANPNGGVYKISEAWYANHYGGANAIQSKCGKHVESWSLKNGGHAEYLDALASKSDLGDRATFVGAFVCPGSVSISSGSGCSMDGANCVKSANYPSNYGNSQLCTVAINPAAKIDVVAFNTERRYDDVIVNGVIYDGSGSGLEGKVTSELSWSSDSSQTYSGWKLCFGLDGTSCSSASQCTSGVCRGSNCCNSKVAATSCTDCDSIGDCAACSPGYYLSAGKCYIGR
jgi:hypothetical protein